MPEDGNNCDVCARPANQRCSGCLSVYYCSKEHQRGDWKKHKKICKPYKLMKDDILGRYLVATRDLKEGEIVLSEPPLIYGPAQHTVAVCVGCGRVLTEQNSRPCSKCGWPVCSIICEQAPCHIPECTYTIQRGNRVMITNFEIVHPIYQCLTVLRCLYQKQFLPEVWKKLITLESHTKERKGTKEYEAEKVSIVQVVLRFFKLTEVFTEEDIMNVCGILKVNGHEVPIQDAPHVAIYKTASMVEHNCRANCWKSFSNKGELLIIAGEPIRKGDHISICYSDPLWSTPNRRHHLHETKFFWCNCSRCQDVTEFGTYFSSVKCQDSSCNGYLLPSTFIEDTNNEKLSDWYCNECKKPSTSHCIQDIVDRLGQDLSEMEKGSVEACKQFITEAEKYLHPNHYYLTDCKFAMAQMVGEEYDGVLREVSNKELDLKAKTCRELIELVKQLVPNEKRIIGILLYTLQATLTENGNRKSSPIEALEVLTEAKTLLHEALKILKHISVISPEGKLYGNALFDMKKIEEAMEKIKTLSLS